MTYKRRSKIDLLSLLLTFVALGLSVTIVYQLTLYQTDLTVPLVEHFAWAKGLGG